MRACRRVDLHGAHEAVWSEPLGKKFGNHKYGFFFLLDRTLNISTKSVQRRIKGAGSNAACSPVLQRQDFFFFLVFGLNTEDQRRSHGFFSSVSIERVTLLFFFHWCFAGSYGLGTEEELWWRGGVLMLSPHTAWLSMETCSKLLLVSSHDQHARLLNSVHYNRHGTKPAYSLPKK